MGTGLKIFCAGLAICAAIRAEAYPDRPGKKTVAKLCSACHGLKLMEPMRKTRAQWRTSVDDMATRGMKAEDDEIEAAVDYLAKYLSRLNVNKAPAAELADVLDITLGEAKLIVDYRAANGDFKNFDEFEKVPGLNVAKLAAQRDRIAFRAASF